MFEKIVDLGKNLLPIDLVRAVSSNKRFSLGELLALGTFDLAKSAVLFYAFFVMPNTIEGTETIIPKALALSFAELTGNLTSRFTNRRIQLTTDS